MSIESLNFSGNIMRVICAMLKVVSKFFTMMKFWQNLQIRTGSKTVENSEMMSDRHTLKTSIAFEACCILTDTL